MAILSGAISLGINGIEAEPVEIEVDIIKGLPNFTIVGLPDSTIRESRERIRSAVENSGYEFPPHNFLVNLAPAGFKKQGASFDLPIAVSILHATAQTSADPRDIPMVGELSLDGRVKPVKGVISMAIALYKRGYKSLIVPWENRNEAAAIDELTVYPVKNISQALDALNSKINAYVYMQDEEAPHPEQLDFRHVRGQETARRALEIAAAGSHNILLYGSPGAGKTMLARRVPTILPPLSREQAIETTMIHSVSGKLKRGSGLITTPPFRSPHHTSSDVSLVGGGQIPTAGEISLSNHGILFLDEFVEFKNNVIQALRQPLEDHEITVARATGTAVFPADFMLIAASNPCQCGHLFDTEIHCSCSPSKVKNYFQKISGPIIDRIDLEVLVNRVEHKDLLHNEDGEDSASIRKRVIKAREIQNDRFRKSRTMFNSRMGHDDINKYCPVSDETSKILEKAIRHMKLSARAYYKILKLSRTIADLDESEIINAGNVLEALSYKNLHRNYDL